MSTGKERSGRTPKPLKGDLGKDIGHLRVEMVPVSKIVGAKPNPKGHDIPAIIGSIRRFGFTVPGLEDAGTGILTVGHGRVEAVKAMMAAGEPRPRGIGEGPDGWTVPILRGMAFKNAQEAQAYLLADNRLTELGGWDEEALKACLRELSEESTLEGIGWKPEEVLDLLGKETDEEEEDAPVPPSKAFSRTGDRWRFGVHIVDCKDGTKTENLDSLLEGRKANACVVDPPWNSAIGLDSNPRHRQRPGLVNDDLPQEEFTRFLEATASILAKYCDGDLYCVMGAEQWPTIDRALRTAGFHWSATIIWAKDLFVLGRSNYQRQYEAIWYGWPKGRTSTFNGARDESDVWQIPRPRRSETHPTSKPIALIERAIRNSSVPGALILDLFSGSGSTLMAAERLGRVFRGFEIEPGYVDVIVKRWMTATGKKPRLERDGRILEWPEIEAAGFSTAPTTSSELSSDAEGDAA